MLPNGLPTGKFFKVVIGAPLTKKVLCLFDQGVHVVMLMTRRKHIEHADSWLGSSFLLHADQDIFAIMLALSTN